MARKGTGAGSEGYVAGDVEARGEGAHSRVAPIVVGAPTGGSGEQASIEAHTGGALDGISDSVKVACFYIVDEAVQGNVGLFTGDEADRGGGTRQQIVDASGIADYLQASDGSAGGNVSSGASCQFDGGDGNVGGAQDEAARACLTSTCPAASLVSGSGVVVKIVVPEDGVVAQDGSLDSPCVVGLHLI